jgi:hypothetical protein
LNACWLKKDILEQTEKSGIMSGRLKNCDLVKQPKKIRGNPAASEDDCCENVLFGSASSEQKHTNGYFKKMSRGPENRWNYIQVSGHQRKLWYSTEVKVCKVS